MLSHGLWCVLGAGARSLLLQVIPWDIFNDGGSAARLAMSRAPLDFGICSADVFVLCVL